MTDLGNVELRQGRPSLHIDFIKSVFNFAHGYAAQPPSSQFRLVVPAFNEQNNKLSPPNRELDEGFYILLQRPPLGSSSSLVPPHLQHLLLVGQSSNPPKRCRWVLAAKPPSGNSGLRMRYCYPNTGETKGVGATLWTKLDADGKDRLDVRFLHVHKRRHHKRTIAQINNKPAAQSTFNNSLGGESFSRHTKTARRMSNASTTAPENQGLPHHHHRGASSFADTGNGFDNPIELDDSDDEEDKSPIKVESADKMESTNQVPIKTESNEDEQGEVFCLNEYSSADIAELLSQKGDSFKKFAQELKEADIHGGILAELLTDGKEAFDSFLDEAGLEGALLRRSVYFDLNGIPRRNDV